MREEPSMDDASMDDANAALSASSRAPLRDDLRQRLLDRIITGQFAPGSRINESRLAAELGVSRTPLREALFHLERDGFVRSDLARGFSVPPLETREVRELYPILESLETLALRSIVPLAAIDTTELRRLNDELSAAAGDFARCIEIDAQWHATLLARCPNRRLLALTETLKNHILRYEQVYMRDASLVAQSVAQHAAIIDAIDANDMPQAVDALQKNWLASLDTLLLCIGEPSRPRPVP
jgi:DNA-binding GntR family transcriptional regulator